MRIYFCIAYIIHNVKIAFNTFFLIGVVGRGGVKHHILDVVSLACLGGSNSFYVICNDVAYYQKCYDIKKLPFGKCQLSNECYIFLI